MKKSGASKPPRVPVPLSDIESNLNDQLGFLVKSTRDFDAGDRSEFRRIALTIRILTHDNPPSSTSLLSQVGLSQVDFVSSAVPTNPANALNEFSLAAISFGTPPLVPLCSTPLPSSVRRVSMPDWLAEPVLRDWDRNLFSRWDFIRVVANQAGGAHVDPQIEERYFNLTQKGGFGWTGSMNGETFEIEEIEKVYIRQIAWETLESVRPAWERVLNNRQCDCGSGRKARYCCKKAQRGA